MGVELVIEPGKVVKWDVFRHYPPFSIAVDGYCEGPPRLSDDGLYLNINHHEGVDRLATASSCMQALVGVKMGLYEAFCQEGKRRATVWANDCDQDVIWATYILTHPKHVDRPRLMALVQLEDLLDKSAGLYPIKKRWHLLRKLLWVSEPYTDARASGRLRELDGQEMRQLVESAHRRIRQTLFGGGREIEPDTEFEVIAEFPRWSFIREIGAHARFGVAQKGLKAFVSIIGSGRKPCRYVVARRSHFIRWFPLERIRDRLNEAEGIVDGADERWSGADNVIGSPRERGSRLSPERVLDVVRRCCEEEESRGAAPKNGGGALPPSAASPDASGGRLMGPYSILCPMEPTLG